MASLFSNNPMWYTAMISYGYGMGHKWSQWVSYWIRLFDRFLHPWSSNDFQCLPSYCTIGSKDLVLWKFIVAAKHGPKHVPQAAQNCRCHLPLQVLIRAASYPRVKLDPQRFPSQIPIDRPHCMFVAFRSPMVTSSPFRAIKSWLMPWTQRSPPVSWAPALIGDIPKSPTNFPEKNASTTATTDHYINSFASCSGHWTKMPLKWLRCQMPQWGQVQLFSQDFVPLVTRHWNMTQASWPSIGFLLFSIDHLGCRATYHSV